MSCELRACLWPISLEAAGGLALNLSPLTSKKHALINVVGLTTTTTIIARR